MCIFLLPFYGFISRFLPSAQFHNCQTLSCVVALDCLWEAYIVVTRFYRRRLRKSRRFLKSLTKMPTQLAADHEIPEIRVKTAYDG